MQHGLIATVRGQVRSLPGLSDFWLGRRRRRVQGRQRLGEAPGEEGQDPRLRLGREVPEEALQEEEQGRHEGVEGVRVRLRVSPRPVLLLPPNQEISPRQDPRTSHYALPSHYNNHNN